MRDFVKTQEVKFYDDEPQYAKEKALLDKIINKGYQK